MTTFVLILNVMFNSPAVVAVPGFESDAACQAAGQLWMKETKTVMGTKLSFVCVGQEKK